MARHESEETRSPGVRPSHCRRKRSCPLVGELPHTAMTLSTLQLQCWDPDTLWVILLLKLQVTASGTPRQNQHSLVMLILEEVPQTCSIFFNF